MAVIARQRAASHTVSGGFVLSLLIVLALALTVIAVSVGAVPIAPLDVVRSFFGSGSTHFFIWQYRMPRILLCWLVGISLAVSGGVIQGVIRNPLAAPDIIGITRGAGFAAAVVVLAFPAAPTVVLPAAAFVGGIVAFALVYFFAYRRGTSTARLALVGIAISALFEAGIRFLIVKYQTGVAAALTWLAGSFYGRQMSDVLEILPWVVVLVPLVILFAHRLDVLGLGDDMAAGLGEPVERTRLLALFFAVVLASSAVAVAGTVGFVGLIAPHMARRLVGSKHLVTLPTAAMIGVVLCLVADTLGRSVAPPIEIPAGLITAMIGGPYFLYLLAKTSG